ncbi:hypothetical protein ACEPAH_5755 [Sanghuangporus vaninii]
MILGVGLDIVHLPRIASLIARRGPERFARRILSQKELAEWGPTKPDSLRFLAVRFSVKEAAYKALYPTCRPTWKELSYIRFGSKFPGSKPELLYDPVEKSLRARVGQLYVSVTHDGEYVASTVIAEAP